MGHVGGVCIPGVSRQEQFQRLASLGRPVRQMMRGPGHDFGGRDQHGRLQDFPTRFILGGIGPAIDRQVNLIHTGVQRHGDRLAPG
ncbi:hypothetical protein D3C72_2197540 [compost metagenome]